MAFSLNDRGGVRRQLQGEPAASEAPVRVTLTPSPDGTLIRWGASWDRTIMGRLVYRPLRNLYPVIVAGLVKAAEAPQS